MVASLTSKLGRFEFDLHVMKYFSAKMSSSDSQSVISDQPERMKHPLRDEWSFWLLLGDKQNWEDNLVELSNFNTVEDYWCLYHHMKVPSELRLGQDYMIFKKGIQPMWEDPQNKKGGRWLIMLDRLTNAQMDAIWADTVLILIGATLMCTDDISGVVVNVRDKNKISVWMKTNDPESVLEVGRKLRKQFKIPYKFNYYKHNTGKAMYSM
ncbi:eukaryotic translation initiation factor 4E1-like isoform X1 [Spodoptera frugiperda]|uniref:eIF-4F 25 kDa subunit n=2 Tax=Spodoptera frugiperda TaxID=7108 RepID=A0A9R0E251_SPOFR|nr:eukaryotic translation initiation factor 4E1-like isoform X1 [Spodoptera frugiperda]